MSIRSPQMLRLPLVVLVSATACGLTDAATSPTGARVPAHFQARVWLYDDGLPHNVVERVVLGARGFLWLGTAGGLARFDGRAFRSYELPSGSTGSIGGIRELASEDARTLALISQAGALWRMRDGVFREHPAGAALAGHTLWDLAAAPEGGLWIGTGENLVLRWQDGAVQTFGTDGEFELNRTFERFSFARDGDGRDWIAGGSFVGWQRDGRLERLAAVRGTSWFVAPAASGGVWIAAREGLWKCERGEAAVQLTGPGWPGWLSGISSLWEQDNGVLWIGTRRHGLYRFVRGRIEIVRTPHDMIAHIAGDEQGNVWLALNGGGVARLRRQGYVILDRAAGLPEDVSSAVCEDAAGAIWCANRAGGLVRFADGRVRVVPAQPDPTGPRLDVTTLAPGPDDNLWVGTQTGLWRMALTEPHRLESIAPVTAALRVLYRTRGGDMWVAGLDHLSLFPRAGGHRSFGPRDGFSGRRVNAIVEDAAGSMWIGTLDGELFEYRDAQFIHHVARDDPLELHRIHSLQVDARGSLWIATLDGLVLRRTNGSYRRFTTADGLPDDFVDQMLESNRGRFWFAGRRGLFHIAAEEFYAVAEGRKEQLVAVTFGKNEGLEGASSFARGQPMTWKAGDGTLWFATYRGVVGLDPTASPTTPPPPPVYIDLVTFDGHPAPTASPLVVPPLTAVVEFGLKGLNLASPEGVRLRHRLEGFDRSWVETGDEGTARYESLPPGRYTLQVEARNSGAGWGDSRVTLALTVQPAWWQTMWFRGGALLALMGVLGLSVRHVALRRLRGRVERLEHEQALERERARIARNLHDELGGNVTRIGLLAERLRRHAHESTFQTELGRLAGHARRIVGDLENIVWTVDPQNDTWNRVANYVGQLAQDFLRDTDLACAVHGVETAPATPVAPETRHHVLAVAKEALHNILKHARATRVEVRLAFRADAFTLTLRDDGVGFDVAGAAATDGNGLPNMRSRLAEIGGTVHIDSAPGAGTTLVLHVPLVGVASPSASDNGRAAPAVAAARVSPPLQKESS